MNTQQAQTKNTMKDESLGNAKETNKQNSNYELIERIEIEDTPFTAIRNDKEWFLTMGKYRLTEPLQSLKEVKENAEKSDWFRVMQIIGIMIEEYETKKNK